MYAPASPFSRPIPAGARAMSGMYQQVGVETSVTGASPHQLVKLLINGWFESAAQAKGALQNRDLAVKSKSLGRAIQIVEEGLLASLDMERGGELSQNLSQLYRYVSLRLTQANLRNDPALIDECISLMSPIREAWLAIDPQAQNPAARKEVTA